MRIEETYNMIILQVFVCHHLPESSLIVRRLPLPFLLYPEPYMAAATRHFPHMTFRLRLESFVHRHLTHHGCGPFHLYLHLPSPCPYMHKLQPTCVKTTTPEAKSSILATEQRYHQTKSPICYSSSVCTSTVIRRDGLLERPGQGGLASTTKSS
jgi:hypothetical protein